MQKNILLLSLLLFTACPESSNPNVCGDGVVGADEQCDDDNTVDGDGCSSVCELESATCGDGTQEGAEACDDGNLIDGDGCSALCEIENTNCLPAPFPIILAHGMGGFDSLGTFEYFFQILDELTTLGDQVFPAEVSQFQSSEVRGAELAGIVDSVLEATGACKVNIIAHSQGGLDTRFIIGTLGYGDRVASVVTIGTPHQGTPLADTLLGLTPGLSDALTAAFLGFFGLAIDNPSDDPNVVASLTTLAVANSAGFAAANPDDPAVAFFSVAGRSLLQNADEECAGALRPNPSTNDPIDPTLLTTGLFLQGINILDPIPNDGMVPVDSQKHGIFLGCIPADHADEIGQLADLSIDVTSQFDFKLFYRDLSTFLHSQGF
jgi:triacylglycerol lipase